MLEAVLDLGDSFNEVLAPVCLDLAHLNLKSLLLGCRLCNLSLDHQVAFLELGALVRIFHLGLDRDADLHRLQSHSVLLDQTSVLS